MTRLGIALLSCALLCACARNSETKTDGAVEDTFVYVLMETSLGDITLALNETRAPISTANFVRYIDDASYDGTIFHRVMPGFVIQGGGYLPDMIERPSYAPIPNEWTNGLKNVRGSIGMAREEDPNSATRQWYINLADNSQLDIAREKTGNAGYAVFGRVVSGMDVVDRIAAVPTHEAGEHLHVPDVPIIINSVAVVPTAQSLP